MGGLLGFLDKNYLLSAREAGEDVIGLGNSRIGTGSIAVVLPHHILQLDHLRLDVGTSVVHLGLNLGNNIVLCGV